MFYQNWGPKHSKIKSSLWTAIDSFDELHLNVSFISKTYVKLIINIKHLEPRCPNQMQSDSETIQIANETESLYSSFNWWINTKFVLHRNSFLFKIEQLMKFLSSSHETKISLLLYHCWLFKNICNDPVEYANGISMKFFFTGRTLILWLFMIRMPFLLPFGWELRRPFNIVT